MIFAQRCWQVKVNRVFSVVTRTDMTSSLFIHLKEEHQLTGTIYSSIRKKELIKSTKLKNRNSPRPISAPDSISAASKKDMKPTALFISLLSSPLSRAIAMCRLSTHAKTHVRSTRQHPRSRYKCQCRGLVRKLHPTGDESGRGAIKTTLSW